MNLEAIIEEDLDQPIALVSHTSHVSRASILQFQDAMGKIPGVQYGDQERCPLKHRFADGIYMRDIFFPKGMLVVGKIHRQAHPNFLMSGDVTVISEANGKQRIKAPFSWVSEAGAKRIIYANEDSLWITVHATDETDLDKIENELIAKSFDELDQGMICHLLQQP